MALRIRKDGTMLCAKDTKEMDGDIYVDDELHGFLGSCYGNSLNILKVVGHDENGVEIWSFVNRGECSKEVNDLKNKIEKYKKYSAKVDNLIAKVYSLLDNKCYCYDHPERAIVCDICQARIKLRNFKENVYFLC